MRLGTVKLSHALLALSLMLPSAVWGLNTTVTLKADSTVTATASEVVTFGLPLAQGDVTNINQIEVLIGGTPQTISVEAGLMWHWTDNSIRSVTIQLQGVDMTGGDVVVTINDGGNTGGTQAFVPHSNGWATAPASKASLPFPRIFAVHNLNYLATTGLVPKYLPGSINSGVGKLQSDQFDSNYGDLSYTDNYHPSWLFDRPTAMLKSYMMTGDLKFLKEGFLGKQHYYGHVRNDGTVPAPAGGDGCWTYGTVACADGKYIYTEPAKLALALFGDSSQWDNDLIVEQAKQANLGWNQPSTSDAYDSENEKFTERGAGIVGLAEIHAWEITGNADVLSTMNSRITSLKDMQQVVQTWDTTNSWTPKSGAFTHSWAEHEGAAYPGDGTTDDRRFSPWMSENIADFLWHVYHVFEPNDTALAINATDVAEMLRLLGNAIDLYGFTSSYVSGQGLDATYQTKAGYAAVLNNGSTISMSCGAEDNVPVSLLYSGSAYASAAALAATANSDGGGADTHNVEVTLPLALAFYFETDAAARTRLFSRISHIERQWFNNSPNNCSTIFNSLVYRMYNWQHRANAHGTYAWAVNEISGVFDVVPNSFSFTNLTNQEPSTEVTSNAITVAGLGAGASAPVSTSAGTLVINGSDCTSNCSVVNGNTVAVKLTTSASSEGSVTANVAIGTEGAAFSAQTKTIVLSYSGYVLVSSTAGCSDGDNWHFQCGSTDQWVPAASYTAHDLIATCGLPDGNTCLNQGNSKRWTSKNSLNNGTFLLNCTSVPPDLTNKSSCPTNDTQFLANGNVVAVDDYPSSFSFTAVSNQGLSNPVTSNTVTIAGLGAGINASTSTTAGTLVINGVDCNAACTVDNGDTLAVRLTTSAAYSTAVSGTVSVGLFNATYTATTSAPPGTTPAAFTLTTVTGAATSSQVTSNTVTLSGLTATANASTTLGTLIINGSDCASSCTVVNGNTVAVRVTTSANAATAVTASVTVGTYSTDFSALTAGAANAPLFFNVTTSLIDQAPEVSQHFWSGMPDMNGDGCFDLFVGTHADENDDSSMFLQNRDNNGCAGSFTYYDTSQSNYTQPAVGTRITGRYIFGNWYADPDGIWSFVGQDVDGGASARYVIADATTPGAIPQYDTKSIGCFGSAMSCIPIDYDGDGVIEMVTRQRSNTNADMFNIRSASDGSLLLAPNPAAPLALNDAVFDVDNDGWPDFLSPTHRGYYTYNSGTSQLEWQADKFPVTVPSTFAADSHMVPLDYDSDGDLDLYFGVPLYSDTSITGVPFALKSDNNVFEIYMYRNNGDGTYTDVTAAAGLSTPGLLKNTYFHSLYGNSVAADINLDGYPDIVYGAEGLGQDFAVTFTYVTLLMNNGNGTFTVNRDNNFGNFAPVSNSSGRPFIGYGDYDNDGRIDIVKTHEKSSDTHQSIALFRNLTDVGSNDWMRVRVRGAGNNTDGLHTRLVFRDVTTDQIVTSYQVGNFNTAYSNLITHAGLGNRSSIKLEVFYPHGGPSYTFNNISTNQDVVIYPDGTILQNYAPGSAVPINSAAAGSYTGATIAPLVASAGADNTPNNFSFTNLTNQATSTAVTSNVVTIAGLGTGINATTTTDNGTLVINGSDCASSCTVANGSTLALRLTTSSSAGSTVSGTVSIGDTFTTGFSATTAGASDTTPDSFALSAQNDVATNTEFTSNTVTIAGLGAGINAPASTNLGTLVIQGSDCNGGCTVTNGQTLAVKVTSSANASTPVNALVTVGTFSTTFTVTTAASGGGGTDTTPDAFSFTNLVDQAVSTQVDSAAITVAGLGAGVNATATTTVGSLVINGTNCTSSCTVDNGDTLAARLTTSGTNSTAVQTTVTVGTFNTNFSATTVAAAGGGGGGADTTPDAFSFTNLVDQAVSTQVDSAAITVAGLGAGVNATATTTVGSLVINGNNCTNSCTVDNGDTLAARLTTSGTNSTAVQTTVTVGTFNTNFSATTVAAAGGGGGGGGADTTPDAFSFTNLVDQAVSTQVDSAAITVAGLGAGVNATATTTVGSLVINGTNCTSSCTVANGDTLAVRLTTSANNATSVSATVNVGTVTTTFAVTTVADSSSNIGGGGNTGGGDTGGGDTGGGDTGTGGGTGSGGTSGSSGGTEVIAGEQTDITVAPGTTVNNQGTLTNLTNSGTVNGGNVGGNINNTPTAVLNNVALQPGSTVNGGKVSGALTGTGTLTNALVDVTSIAPTVSIGSGSKVSSATISNVSGLNLSNALKDEQGNIKLDQPLVVTADGTELSALDIAKSQIDQVFGGTGTSASSGSGDGSLQITTPGLNDVVVPVKPLSVQTTNEPDSVSIVNSAGQLEIIKDGIKTTFAPAAADVTAFQAGLTSSGASANLSDNGHVSVEFNGSSFSLRFSPVASMPPAAGVSSPLARAALNSGEATFGSYGSPANPSTYRIYINYPDGSKQELIPAVHDADAFNAWITEGGFTVTVDGLTGTILIQDKNLSGTNQNVWYGIPAYDLLPATGNSVYKVDFNNATDLNGDGIGDIYFDTGANRQVIYGLTPP